jgi:hypothetical protein
MASRSLAVCGFLLLANKHRVGRVQPSGALGKNAPAVVVIKEVTIVIQLPGGIVIAARHSSNFALGCWGLCAVLVNPLLLGCSELCIFLRGLVLVGLKPSDLVHLSLVWGSSLAWASAATPAAMSTSATTSSSGVMAPAAAKPSAAKLGNVAHVGRVLFKVTDEVSKQRQTRCEGLFFFPHGQHLADHGLDCIVLDFSQQMMDLGALIKATVAVLHQVLGNGVLLDMGISITGPVPVLLLAVIGQICKAGFHLVGKIHDHFQGNGQTGGDTTCGHSSPSWLRQHEATQASAQAFQTRCSIPSPYQY